MQPQLNFMLRASQHILSLFKAVPPCYTTPPPPSPVLVSQPGIYSTPVNGWNTPSCEWRAESAAHVTSNTGAEGLLWGVPRCVLMSKQSTNVV